MATNNNNDPVEIKDCSVDLFTQQLRKLHDNGVDISTLVAHANKGTIGPENTPATTNVDATTVNNNSSNEAGLFTQPEEETESTTPTGVDSMFLSNGQLIYTKKLFETLPKEHHQEVTNSIIGTMKRIETVRNKMRGITNLRRNEFTPKKLRVVKNACKLDYDDLLANNSKICAQQVKWDQKMEQFVKDMKKIIIDASTIETKELKDKNIIASFKIIESLAKGITIATQLQKELDDTSLA